MTHYDSGKENTPAENMRMQISRKLKTNSQIQPSSPIQKSLNSNHRSLANLTLRSISLLRGWSNIETDFLKRWSIPHACQCLRGIRTMCLTTCFHLVNPELVRQLEQMILVSVFQLKQSILSFNIPYSFWTYFYKNYPYIFFNQMEVP